MLKKNSVDYHDGVYCVAMCKFWNIAKKFFFRIMCCIKINRNVFIIIFNSKSKATFDGVDILKLSWENYKKEGENSDEEGR